MTSKYECTAVSPYAEGNGFKVGTVYDGVVMPNGDVMMYSTKYNSYFCIGNITESGIARFKEVNNDQ